MNTSSVNNAEFDGYAADYDAALAQGVSVSGEDKNYFAQGRIAWLADCLRQLQTRPRSVMDFGCGTGSATNFLLEAFGAERMCGVDVSAKSLAVAKKMYGGRAQFLLFNEYEPSGEVDLAFCNGVFHHVAVAERAAAVSYIYRSLRRGGLLALWENNPWNPGTRYVMSRIPFDRDAVTLTAGETRRLLGGGGFEVVRTDYLFIFPRVLRWLRRIEPIVSKLPIGAQYLVLCRKP